MTEKERLSLIRKLVNQLNQLKQKEAAAKKRSEQQARIAKDTALKIEEIYRSAGEMGLVDQKLCRHTQLRWDEQTGPYCAICLKPQRLLDKFAG